MAFGQPATRTDNKNSPAGADNAFPLPLCAFGNNARFGSPSKNQLPRRQKRKLKRKVNKNATTKTQKPGAHGKINEIKHQTKRSTNNRLKLLKKQRDTGPK